jgi:hypothetical protein
MRKYDAKNPMEGHGGRRSLCCSCMTMRMQKRDSYITGRFEAWLLPTWPNAPHFRGVSSPVHSQHERFVDSPRRLPTTGDARAAL